MIIGKHYRFGFDIWALVLFVAVMIPTVIWTFVPAPNDILRTGSVIPTVDSVASVLQSIAIACLCIVINNDAGNVRFSPLVIISALFVLIYYAGWAVYYSGINTPWVILLLTVPPCLALILYATDRKNVPALILAIGFAICHLVFAIVNFIR